jgi:hypothetical protein
MALDRNPKFGADQAFAEGARRVTDFLWENTGGDLSMFPQSYLETLRYEFSDGRVSMLELMDRVDLGPEASYEDYCEVREALMQVDPSKWPNPEKIVEIPVGHLLYEIEPDLDFSEFNFEEELVTEEMVTEGPGGEVLEVDEDLEEIDDPLSSKMELFFKKVISSVYMDGVTEVTDLEGNPPNESNNYLMAPDGKSFAGIFYDSPPNEQAKKFPFKITEGANGKWQIKY